MRDHDSDTDPESYPEDAHEESGSDDEDWLETKASKRRSEVKPGESPRAPGQAAIAPVQHPFCPPARGDSFHGQVIGVMRHCERDDTTFDCATGNRGDLWECDPDLSDSGRVHATEIGTSLGEDRRFRFDIVVSSPYRRCIETAVLLCKKLQVPLGIDRRFGEVQHPSVLGVNMSCEGLQPLHRSDVENIEFAKANGVEVIGLEDFYGKTAAPDELPAWPESFPKAFRRYAKAFELLVSSGKSIACVTHGLALLSIGRRFCPVNHRLSALTNPGMGDFFVCNLSCPMTESSKQSPRYAIITSSLYYDEDDRDHLSDDEDVLPRQSGPRGCLSNPPSSASSTPTRQKAQVPLLARRGILLKASLRMPPRASKEVPGEKDEQGRAHDRASQWKRYTVCEAADILASSSPLSPSAAEEGRRSCFLND
jgi:broad specificity phosphatase PhoE